MRTSRHCVVVARHDEDGDAALGDFDERLQRPLDEPGADLAAEQQVATVDDEVDLLFRIYSSNVDDYRQFRIKTVLSTQGITFAWESWARVEAREIHAIADHLWTPVALRTCDVGDGVAGCDDDVTLQEQPVTIEPQTGFDTPPQAW